MYFNKESLRNKKDDFFFMVGSEFLYMSRTCLSGPHFTNTVLLPYDDYNTSETLIHNSDMGRQ